MPWYSGVLLGAERFMASWHKSQQEASRSREVNRAAEALLVNHKAKAKTRQREKARRRKGAEREREREGKRVPCLFVCFLCGSSFVYFFPQFFILLP